MKTVSTKLSKEDFEEFQECCNNDGKCSSEYLRDLIKMDIEAWKDSEEEPLRTEGKIIEVEPKSERKMVSDVKIRNGEWESELRNIVVEN